MSLKQRRRSGIFVECAPQKITNPVRGGIIRRQPHPKWVWESREDMSLLTELWKSSGPAATNISTLNGLESLRNASDGSANFGSQV